MPNEILERALRTQRGAMDVLSYFGEIKFVKVLGEYLTTAGAVTDYSDVVITLNQWVRDYPNEAAYLGCRKIVSEETAAPFKGLISEASIKRLMGRNGYIYGYSPIFALVVLAGTKKTVGMNLRGFLGIPEGSSISQKLITIAVDIYEQKQREDKSKAEPELVEVKPAADAAASLPPDELSTFAQEFKKEMGRVEDKLPGAGLSEAVVSVCETNGHELNGVLKRPQGQPGVVYVDASVREHNNTTAIAAWCPASKRAVIQSFKLIMKSTDAEAAAVRLGWETFKISTIITDCKTVSEQWMAKRGTNAFNSATRLPSLGGLPTLVDVQFRPGEENVIADWLSKQHQDIASGMYRQVELNGRIFFEKEPDPTDQFTRLVMTIDSDRVALQHRKQELLAQIAEIEAAITELDRKAQAVEEIKSLMKEMKKKQSELNSLPLTEWSETPLVSLTR